MTLDELIGLERRYLLPTYSRYPLAIRAAKVFTFTTWRDGATLTWWAAWG